MYCITLCLQVFSANVSIHLLFHKSIKDSVTMCIYVLLISYVAFPSPLLAVICVW